MIAALDEWASQRWQQQKPVAPWQKPANLAQALEIETGSNRSELRAIMTRGNLRREYALSALAMALRPVPVPFDAGPGADRTRLRKLVAATDAATEPVLGMLLLVRALRVAGNDNLAESLLRAALRARPQMVTLHNALGQLLMGQQRWQEAVEVYATLRGIRPESGLNLANALLDSGRHKEGLALFQRLRAERKDDPMIPLHYGNALSAQGLLKEAEAAYQQALRRAHNNFAGAHNNLGIVLRKQGRLNEAVSAYRAAIRLNPDYAEAHSNLSTALSAQSRHKEAQAACREAIRLNPDLAEAHNNLGHSLLVQEQYKEAEVEFRQAIRLKPDYLQPHLSPGNALSGQGRHKEAEAAYQETIRLKPDYAEVYSNLGNALYDQRRFKEAEVAHREAIRLKPEYAEAHGNLGRVLSAQGKLAEAAAAYCEAIRLKPSHAASHNDLGSVLGKQGKDKEAETACREAIRLQKDDPEAWLNLGSALRGQGQFQAALEAYRRGHELGSKQPGWSLPSGYWVRVCQRLIQLDGLLHRVLGGAAEPANDPERLDLAILCQEPSKRLHRTAVRFVTEAFSANPKLADLKSQPRYHGACSAALAATGQAEDARLLPDRIVSALHRQAHTWLLADLARYSTDLNRDPRFSKTVQQRLTHWQKDPDLAAVGDKDALTRLPEDERIAWRKLWAEVQSLLDQTKPKK